MTQINYAMLAIARESRGLTQNQLVEKVQNLNQGNYSKMEKGLLPIQKKRLLILLMHLGTINHFFSKRL